MTTATIHPAITPGDRLGLTICIAIIVHTMVVLGVSFAPEPIPGPRYDSMEVILVTQKSDTPPDDADLLAQAALQGGGESERVERPAAPIATPLPAPTPEVAATPAPPLEPDPRVAATEPAPVDAPVDPVVEPAAEPERVVHETPVAEMPAPQARERPDKPEKQVAEAPPPAPPAAPAPVPDTAVLPTAAELITRSFALASLNAELQQKLEMRSKRPRRKFISANTREYRYAAYMEAWRAKVERIGNLNYPDEARMMSLSGDLLLDVALDPDGAVREITVRRSSGHKVLDDAAVRIVELAAPYAPFPADIAREVDILHVTRTWKFLNSYRFSSR